MARLTSLASSSVLALVRAKTLRAARLLSWQHKDCAVAGVSPRPTRSRFVLSKTTPECPTAIVRTRGPQEVSSSESEDTPCTVQPRARRRGRRVEYLVRFSATRFGMKWSWQKENSMGINATARQVRRGKRGGLRPKLLAGQPVISIISGRLE